MVTEDIMPIFMPSAFSFSVMLSGFVFLSTSSPMTPLWVFTPQERAVAVEAESGQNEVES
ncbi:hypothetical protein SDC9_198509 [bioreactor metagenome]|uniref:Uncharacterized protein n=1 Tax=bioreactor metagenome TaxID=1076179 RepID=A0A645IK82_9ZZZZ